MSLTDRFVKSIKSTDKTQRHYDGLGLYIEVSPKGNKWWRQKYRIHGKEKRIAHGVYPEVSLKEARTLTLDAKLKLHQGLDPMAEKKQGRMQKKDAQENTFRHVARQWYEDNKGGWSEKYARDVMSKLEHHIFPWIGEVAISDLTGKQLREVLRKMEAKGINESAHRTLGICKQIFYDALSTELVDTNVAMGLRLKPVESSHHASITDPTHVGEVLRLIDSYQATPQVTYGLRLAPLLFVRPGELRKAKWTDMDFDNAQWRFTSGKKKKDLIVPLSRQAITILKSLKLHTEISEFVFPNARTRSKPMSDNAINAALRNLGIPKEDLCGHGFRAMARTILEEELGYPYAIIELQLTHTVRDSLGRAYNRTQYLSERTEMMQAWADYLDTLKGQDN